MQKQLDVVAVRLIKDAKILSTKQIVSPMDAVELLGKQMCELVGIPVLDHIIVGADSKEALRENLRAFSVITNFMLQVLDVDIF